MDQAADERVARQATYTWPAPITLIIIVLNVAMFVVTAILARSILNPSINVLIRLGANYGPKTLEGQPWRLLTSIFLHGGLAHLVFNMWAFLNLGVLAEVLFRRRNFLAIYFLSGLAGSVASLVWHPQVVGVGASGAIFGVAGALIPALYLRRIPRARAVFKRDLVSIVIFVLFNLFWGAQSSHVDNAAHLGGLTMGLLLGLVLHIPMTREPLRASMRDVVGIAAAIVLIAVTFIYTARKNAGLGHLVRAQEFLRTGKAQPAINEARKAIAQRPTYPDAQAVLGAAYLQSEQFNDALTAFQRLVEIAPSSAEGYSGLCSANFRLEHFDAAATMCSKAVELDPKSADLYYKLALVHYAARQYNQAEAAFKKVAELEPKSHQAYYGLGVVYLEKGQYQYAADALNKAVALKPDDRNARQRLHDAYSRLGMTDEARAALAGKTERPPQAAGATSK